MTPFNHLLGLSRQSADCSLPVCLCLKPQVLYWWWIHRQPAIPTPPAVRHTDEPQQGRNSCLWLYHLCSFGMTGEATTGSRLNRTESPSPSLLNTVYSEAGWFGVIFPVCSQTVATIVSVPHWSECEPYPPHCVGIVTHPLLAGCT